MPRDEALARVAGVILAAGASRRMGTAGSKMRLDVDGEPMVRRVVRRAQEAGLAPIVVVVGHDAVAVRGALAGLDCAIVENRDFTGPTSTSLHAGLRALESVEAAVVLLGDMPHVTSAMVAALVEGARGTPAPLVVSRYGKAEGEGVLAPPLLFRRALWPELLAWHGEGCGKAVVMAHREEALMLDWPGAALRDIDTPADYEELRR